METLFGVTGVLSKDQRQILPFKLSHCSKKEHLSVSGKHVEKVFEIPEDVKKDREDE